jgi:hypothetical protein
VHTRRAFQAVCRPIAFPLLVLAVFAVLAPLQSGCSSSSTPGTQASPVSADSGVVGCSGTTDTYTANLVKAGTLGKYTFTLVSATPAPPDLNENVWKVKIADSNGASPDLSQVIAYPFMPLMGHSSDLTPTMAANADGTFTVSTLDFFMPGLWTVTLSVTDEPSPDAGLGETPATIDKAVYTFCVNQD